MSPKTNIVPEECGYPNCPTKARQALDEAQSTPTFSLCSRCRTIAYCSRDCQAASWTTHKTDCKRPNYVIKFHLHPGKIINPPVIRTLSCPSDADLYTLHLALQLAFGWATRHTFDFAVLNPDHVPIPEDNISQRAQLLEIQVATGQNPASMTPEYLIRFTDPITQTRYHQGTDQSFACQRRHPRTKQKNADKHKLYQLLDDPQWAGKEIVYVYDFGDNWEHFLTVEGRAARSDNFQVLSGTGHYVAEDVGSFTGWEELKRAYRASDPTEEQRNRKIWFERVARNADPRGLAGGRVSYFEKDEINRIMVSGGIKSYFENKYRQREEREGDPRRVTQMVGTC